MTCRTSRLVLRDLEALSPLTAMSRVYRIFHDLINTVVDPLVRVRHLFHSHPMSLSYIRYVARLSILIFLRPHNYVSVRVDTFRRHNFSSDRRRNIFHVIHLAVFPLLTVFGIVLVVTDFCPINRRKMFF